MIFEVANWIFKGLSCSQRLKHGRNIHKNALIVTGSADADPCEACVGPNKPMVTNFSRSLENPQELF